MNDLCAILNDAAAYVHYWLEKQPAVKEESLTDWLLFEISERSNLIKYRAYTRHQEGRTTGADWEWWIIGKTSSLRLRVQAKKALGKKDLYPNLMRTTKHGLQIEKLIADAKAVNAIPMYAFFSSIRAYGFCSGLGPKPGGVYLSSAHRIQSTFLAKGRAKIIPKDVLSIANPISCAFCCPLSKKNQSLIEYFHDYFAEEFSAKAPDNERVGLHEELPWYIKTMLDSENVNNFQESDESDIPSGFNAVLIIDLRKEEHCNGHRVET